MKQTSHECTRLSSDIEGTCRASTLRLDAQLLRCCHRYFDASGPVATRGTNSLVCTSVSL
ncbi:hypothetical protein C8Q80DRAFT_372173 [Daedaleopsis nitida]|nr:hypothetical protein C8Q80DRAFT_372173 [Daedaleopsis nitida]